MDDVLVLCRHAVTGAEVAFLPVAVDGWRACGWTPVAELDQPEPADEPESPRRRRGASQ